MSHHIVMDEKTGPTREVVCSCGEVFSTKKTRKTIAQQLGEHLKANQPSQWQYTYNTGWRL